jgi:cytoplasmic iron level regulating protein YaaA (DUF328/UPF0246 family)
MTNYILLLPPSEGKTKGGIEDLSFRRVENSKQYNSFIELQNVREEVYNKLREAINEIDETSLEKVFGVKGKNLHASSSTILDMLNSPTMPAIERFSGVMFKAINYEKLDLAEKENFNSTVIFIDGMFGLLRPQDYLPEYKLKITSKYLDIDVTKFWKERLLVEFDILFRDKLVIDILPEAHRKVLTLPTNINYVQITFMDFVPTKSDKNKQSEVSSMDKIGGKFKQAGHNSKELKGELVRYLVSFENIKREKLESFSHSSGYKYSKELSNEAKVVYLKSHK